MISLLSKWFISMCIHLSRLKNEFSILSFIFRGSSVYFTIVNVTVINFARIRIDHPKLIAPTSHMSANESQINGIFLFIWKALWIFLNLKIKHTKNKRERERKNNINVDNIHVMPTNTKWRNYSEIDFQLTNRINKMTEDGFSW